MAEFLSLIHGSKTWCYCNMCHHLVVMSWLFAMRDVLLGCLNSMLDHCIISMFLDHTCFVTQKSSSRFFTNFIIFHQILQQKKLKSRDEPSPAISPHQGFEDRNPHVQPNEQTKISGVPRLWLPHVKQVDVGNAREPGSLCSLES